MTELEMWAFASVAVSIALIFNIILSVQLHKEKVMNQEIKTKFPAFKSLVHEFLDTYDVPDHITEKCRIVARLNDFRGWLDNMVNLVEERRITLSNKQARIYEITKLLYEQQEKIDQLNRDEREAWGCADNYRARICKLNQQILEIKSAAEKLEIESLNMEVKIEVENFEPSRAIYTIPATYLTETDLKYFESNFPSRVGDVAGIKTVTLTTFELDRLLAKLPTRDLT